jgi:hypothetical protein
VNDVVEASAIGTDIALKVNGVIVGAIVDDRLADGAYIGIGLNSGSGAPEPSVDDFTLLDSAHLTWTPAACPASVIESYEIYRSVDGAAFALLDTVTVTYDDDLRVAAASYEYYDDTVDTGAHSYQYRIIGLAAQGEDSPVSNTVTS